MSDEKPPAKPSAKRTRASGATSLADVVAHIERASAETKALRSFAAHAHVLSEAVQSARAFAAVPDYVADVTLDMAARDAIAADAFRGVGSDLADLVVQPDARTVAVAEAAQAAAQRQETLLASSVAQLRDPLLPRGLMDVLTTSDMLNVSGALTAASALDRLPSVTAEELLGGSVSTTLRDMIGHDVLASMTAGHAVARSIERLVPDLSLMESVRTAFDGTAWLTAERRGIAEAIRTAAALVPPTIAADFLTERPPSPARPRAGKHTGRRASEPYPAAEPPDMATVEDDVVARVLAAAASAATLVENERPAVPARGTAEQTAPGGNALFVAFLVLFGVQLHERFPGLTPSSAVYGHIVDTLTLILGLYALKAQLAASRPRRYRVRQPICLRADGDADAELLARLSAGVELVERDRLDGWLSVDIIGAAAGEPRAGWVYYRHLDRITSAE